MSFYQYIINNDSNSIFWFKKTFDVEVLPKHRICSSKALRDILKPQLYDFMKNYIFKQCYLEYFKHKLLESQQEFGYELPIR
jgi:hypothetical protein